MKVELKKVSFSERLSEETNAFAADIWINGKKAGDCQNDGHGGCTYYHFTDPSVRDAFEAYAKSLPSKTLTLEGHEPWEMKMNGEHLIDDLFGVWLAEREEKKLAKLDLKSKADFAAKGYPVTVRITTKGFTTWTAMKSADQLDAVMERFKVKHPKETVVSTKLV